MERDGWGRNKPAAVAVPVARAGKKFLSRRAEAVFKWHIVTSHFSPWLLRKDWEGLFMICRVSLPSLLSAPPLSSLTECPGVMIHVAQKVGSGKCISVPPVFERRDLGLEAGLGS